METTNLLLIVLELLIIFILFLVLGISRRLARIERILAESKTEPAISNSSFNWFAKRRISIFSRLAERINFIPGFTFERPKIIGEENE